MSKRLYQKPELMVHGNVETITQAGGGSRTDVPRGTTVTNINDITS
ncbi:MAG: lasso peptide [Oculatellaceae cyanobacterium Prado106]|nr:lasso peptide [Oculatellaceae cyanobacterium Prado106]